MHNYCQFSITSRWTTVGVQPLPPKIQHISRARKCPLLESYNLPNKHTEVKIPLRFLYPYCQCSSFFSFLPKKRFLFSLSVCLAVIELCIQLQPTNRGTNTFSFIQGKFAYALTVNQTWRILRWHYSPGSWFDLPSTTTHTSHITRSRKRPISPGLCLRLLQNLIVAHDERVFQTRSTER